MARTYWSEGRNVAHGVKGILIISSLSIYFYVTPNLHYGFLFGMIIGSIIIGEISGTYWTNKRRAKVKNKKKQPSSPQSKRITKLSSQELLKAQIDTLSGEDFERLIEMYYTDKGYSVQRVGGSGDHEVDLILKGKEGYKIAVQCKRWKQNVGNDIVLRLKAGKQVHGCLDAWIITTSHYTKAAQEAAERLNIKLINGLQVHDMITSWRKKKLAQIK